MKIHIVKKGDTLYKIAQKYNVTLEELIQANPGIANPDAIDVGLKVKIPAPSSASPYELIHKHTVQQGDSLWKLSKAWGISLSDLIKANPQLKNPNVLLTGEIVNIPKIPLTPVASNPPSPEAKANMPKKPTGKKLTAVKEELTEAVVLPAPVAKPEAEKPVEKPVEKAAEKPMEKPIEKPMEKPIEKPMEKAEEKAAEKPLHEKMPFPAPVFPMEHDLFAPMPMPAVEAGMPTGTAPVAENIPSPYPGLSNASWAVPSKDFGYGGLGHNYGVPYSHDFDKGYPYGVEASKTQMPANVESAIGSVFDPHDISGYGAKNEGFGDISNKVAGQSASAPLPGVTGYLPAYVPGLVSPSAVKPDSGCAGCGGVPSAQALPAAPNAAYAPSFVSPMTSYEPYAYPMTPMAYSPYEAFSPSAFYSPYMAANFMPAAVFPEANLMPSFMPEAVSPAAGTYPGLGFAADKGYPFAADAFGYPAGMPVYPGAVSPYAHEKFHAPYGVPYGADPFGIPPISSLPPLRDAQSKPQDEAPSASLHAAEEESGGREATLKKRQPAKKKSPVPRRSKSRTKQSLPWIR